MDFDLIAILTGVAFVAGFVDSIAGGGGLLALPALLVELGVPCAEAISQVRRVRHIATAVEEREQRDGREHDCHHARGERPNQA